ncbi:MAG TPA: amidohydrolase family protein [Gemmatimonadaceae bacterium]|nr:amidohydrolase family protein [Gemmatimonadaceae bacterium]
MRTRLLSLALVGAAVLVMSPAAANAQTIAITGGTVHPVSGPPIENGTVLIRDGRIAAVGANVTVPADARRIDATGKWVTPGFINSATTLGLSEAGGPSFSGGYNDTQAEGADGIAASFNAWRGLNPASTFIAPARDEGVTSVVVLPGGGGMVSGAAALIDLMPGTVREMVRKAPVAMLGDFGDPTAGTNARAEFWAKWRALIADTRIYAERKQAYENGATRDFITRRSELEAMLPVVNGELPLLLSANRKSDIEAALDFAREMRVTIWLSGAAEGWMIADRIAAANVPVLTGAMNNIPESFSALGQRQENAALLRAAGVRVVLIGNGPGDPASFNVRNIRQEAGNAVAYGLPWDEALRAITLTPAEVLGVADSVGSIAPGRVANIVIWSGDPFEFASQAEHVFVRGAEYTAPSRQEQLIERYRTLPPRYRQP